MIPVGPTGQALNSSYGSRDKPEYKLDLGMAVARFCAIVPDGLLVFFPSYVVLQACIEFWKRTENRGARGFSTIWDSINERKLAVIEPKVCCPSSPRSPLGSSCGRVREDFCPVRHVTEVLEKDPT